MKESESVELKKSLAELKDGLNSIAAILNKHGAGELWFGVRSDGVAIGGPSHGPSHGPSRPWQQRSF
jgi:ATP-dependent DNA helicase RecG